MSSFREFRKSRHVPDAVSPAQQGSLAMPLQALTVDAFAAVYALSRAKLYELWAAGEGPDYYRVGARRFISLSSAQRWQEGLEKALAG